MAHSGRWRHGESCNHWKVRCWSSSSECSPPYRSRDCGASPKPLVHRPQLPLMARAHGCSLSILGQELADTTRSIELVSMLNQHLGSIEQIYLLLGTSERICHGPLRYRCPWQQYPELAHSVHPGALPGCLESDHR